MKTLRNSVVTTFLLLPAVATLVVVPVTSLAQYAEAGVRSLQANADGRLEPGTLLTFRLEGTPRGQASLRIRGVGETISLRENGYGVYVGSYTLKRGDRIAPESQVRVTVDDGYRPVAADYQLGDILPRFREAAPAARLAEPRIERFAISPVERMEPGAELRFSLEGTPGAAVGVDLPGVSNNFGLREVRPGFYEGNYTVRRADNFNPNRPIVATLRIGDRASTANVPFPGTRQAVDNRPPTLTFLDPSDGARVTAGPSVHIAATFEDAGGSGIDPASVRIFVSGRDVTPQSQVNTKSVSFWGPLPPGRHIVEVTGRDLAGNGMRKSWGFEAVAPGVPVPVAATPVPVPLAVAPVASGFGVQFTNRNPNEEIGPDPVLVAARTAPGALVSVRAQAFPPPTVNAPPRVIFSQTLQANREGIVSFTMVPGIPNPGERYEIVMAPLQGNLRGQESRLVLVQRQN